MSGVKPFFLTGGNAKIIVNNVTLAYCTNVSYTVTINHATPRVLGMYESTGVEPLSYSVSGSFAVVRYVSDVKDNIDGESPFGVSAAGNGIGNIGPDGLGKRLAEGLNLSATDGRTYDNLNPAKLDKATGFEIRIYQKLPNGEQQSVARIRDARITRADFSISSKRAPAMQVFNFTAVYADEDSFLSESSGNGQQFQ